MALPSISVNPIQGSARRLVAGEDRMLVIGPASDGIKETKIYTFGNMNDVASEVGYGPGQVATELAMSQGPSGFGTVDMVVASGSVAGSVTEVTKSANITVGGTPNASYDIRIEITNAGDPGDGRFKYSLDGGDTFTRNIRIPSGGEYTLSNTGLSASFGGTGYTTDDTAHFDVDGPGMNSTDLSNCINTLSTSNRNYTLILVADDQKDPANNLFTETNSHISTLNDTYFKHTQAVVPVGGETTRKNRDHADTVGDKTHSDVLSEHKDDSTTTGNFVASVAERASVVAPVPFPGYGRPRLPFAFPVAAHFHAVGSDLSKNPAQDKIQGITDISHDEFKDGSVYHDENIIAPRTFQGEPGFYVNQGLLKSDPTSTWDIWAKARVTSRARTVLRQALRRYLHSRVRTKTDGTGQIDERDKARIEVDVNKQLRAALLTPQNGEGFLGHVTDLLFTVNAENNLLSTSKLEGNLVLVPFAYPDTIEANISLGDSVEVEAV